MEQFSIDYRLDEEEIRMSLSQVWLRQKGWKTGIFRPGLSAGRRGLFLGRQLFCRYNQLGRRGSGGAGSLFRHPEVRGFFIVSEALLPADL